MLFESWSDLRYRLRALFRRAEVERELDTGLRFHIEREAEKLERSGMSRAAAKRAATLAFGGVDRVKSRDVLRLVVGEGLRVTLFGVAVGVGLAAAAAGKVGSLLFNESPHDPAVYGVVVGTLIIAGILASAIPAARATRVDPNVALHDE